MENLVYYAENFEYFCCVENKCGRDDKFSIATLQEIFNDSNKLKILKN
jgi:hypothetical protein